MPLSRSRDYLSIGEVLEAVSKDFPDVSISKIRFLEAEGLISPERTESGYRKFYEEDVARLRYILALQRDQFLPLKVIRERLDSNGGRVPEAVGAPTSTPPPDPPAAAGPELSDVALDRAGLARAAGLSEDEMGALVDFGVLATKDAYDGCDLAAAKAARGLFKYGIEPRHLRMYRQTADREAAFFEQIVSPMTLRKDQDAPVRVSQAVRELLELSRRMREALLQSSLRDLI